MIASCYDVDTCTTTSGERFRLASINSPEPRRKRAEPVPAKAAQDHLRDLVVARRSEFDTSPKTATNATWQSYSLGRRTFSGRWSALVTLRSISGRDINATGGRQVRGPASSAKWRHETTNAALFHTDLGSSSHCLLWGWYDKKEKPELSTVQSETLTKYSEFYQSCMDIQMTMWGK